MPLQSLMKIIFWIDFNCFCPNQNSLSSKSCCLFQKVMCKKFETDFTLLKENTNFEPDSRCIPIPIGTGSVLG